MSPLGRSYGAPRRRFSPRRSRAGVTFFFRVTPRIVLHPRPAPDVPTGVAPGFRSNVSLRRVFMPASLSRKVRFSAAHHYRRPEWSDSENEAAFGGSRFQHGHNFELTVTVTGPIDESTGFVTDLGRLDATLEELVRPLDQRDLTVVLEDFRPGGTIPSTEALARWCWRRLANEIPPPAKLARVRVSESDDLWSEYSEP